MGGSSSKQPEFKVDYTNAQFSASDIASQAQQYAQSAASAAAEQAQSAAAWSYKPLLWILGIGLLAVGGILIYDVIAMANDWPTLILPNDKTPAPLILFIDSAEYGVADATTGAITNPIMVADHISSQIQNQTTLPSFPVSYSNLGLQTNPIPSTAVGTLILTYHQGDELKCTLTLKDGDTFPVLPETTCGGKTASGVSSTGPSSTDKDAPPPPYLTKVYNSIFGSSSGELSPSFHDASSSATIKANLAPLSAQRDGGYGMQWWMYVKDWNYGFGKKKSVIKRPDATNRAVMNPDISLHPTDNSLQVSVSVYPSTEGGSGKAQPAPAGHSGSSDDVFVCDVANIPLQTWFSVSLTVFGRNMDIYIDGKLVKSCFLSGVPKPAVGDISLTPDGGFSGRVCGFYHYPKMLTPSDAMSFWAAGTPCRNQTTSGGGSATGYNIKFGVYDALGKEVQEYAF
jgi:hypothetical protein